MTEISWVTCHQPSPEGLKVPWLEPALLAGSATNSGDPFPPGGKQSGASFFHLCREVSCDGRHAAKTQLVTCRNNIYIYMEIKHIFGYTFSSHDDLLACCMASRPMIFCTKALLYIFQAVCVTKEMLICGKGVLVNLF